MTLLDKLRSIKYVPIIGNTDNLQTIDMKSVVQDLGFCFFGGGYFLHQYIFS